MWGPLLLMALASCVIIVLPAKNISTPLAKKESTGSHQTPGQVHLPWFHDADRYWDFNNVVNNTILDSKRAQRSRIEGSYRAIPGPKDDPALELQSADTAAYVILGDFANTCLPNVQECHRGFTICFWVNLRKVLHDGVLFQLGLSRRSRGITVKTDFKDRRAFLTFFVNTPTRNHRIETEFTSNMWHHVEIVWNANAADQKNVAVFVNCSKVGSSKVVESKSGRRASRKFILGANHAGRKATPFALDDFAIWFKSLERRRLCQIVNEKRVHGNYSSWSIFSPCSSSCGSGTRIRERFCNNPSPDYGGKDCSSLGLSFEDARCNEKPCPVAGGYTPWSNFSRCSSSCGGGTRYRSRNCTQPIPQHGGVNCSRLGKSLEVQDCNTNACPVNGNYSVWSDFSHCDKSCGTGFQVRNRSCTKPEPQFGGKDCSTLGLTFEMKECNLRPCPVNGNYSIWSDFSPCDKSCGTGFKVRNRSCTNPEPRFGGKDCSTLGLAYEMKECNLRPCPINGNYSAWSDFSSCDTSCGIGLQVRNRSCTKPEPQFGGRNCSTLGLPYEARVCNLRPCPINGNYSVWSDFSPCDKACGIGLQVRNRSCTNPEPQFGGKDCSTLGLAYEMKECNLIPCPVNGNYSVWSDFSSCDTSCGIGLQVRNRSCTNPEPQFGGKDCSTLGLTFEVRECNLRPCPINGNYSVWSDFSPCNKSCGTGLQVRNRSCTNPEPQFGGKDCSTLGLAYEMKECNLRPCPINGNYSAWSDFSSCDTSCGIGLQVRNRSCTKPEPQFGGRNCSTLGLPYEARMCNLRPCPINGNYSVWSNFSHCDKSCGTGFQIRNRSCTNPEPQFGGRDCSTLGLPFEMKECNLRPCPINGNYSIWSNFSPCDKACGTGLQVRNRSCTNPEPQFGGKDCSTLGLPYEVKKCNLIPCPVNGNYSVWSDFSSCDTSCGIGLQVRNRSCTKPEPQFGGKDCSTLGLPFEVRECNLRPCPINGNYSVWSDFSPCDKSCGTGFKVRNRSCTNPEPRFGGKDCSTLGLPYEARVCNLRRCPINGNYSVWSDFSTCDKSCGTGFQVRNRSCTNPKPQFGGRDCSTLGLLYEVIECNLRLCPMDGGYSEWSPFTSCSASCGYAMKSRNRTCTNPEPSNGGDNCSILGPNTDTVLCNNTHCPIHGNYSDWSSFTPCDKTCGNGSKIRRRYCTNPEPRFVGRNCSRLGSSTETTSCNQFPCPVHGNFSEWSRFSECTSTCGNSTKTRTRNCTNPVPMHGGNDCSSQGLRVHVVPCVVAPCPVDGNYSTWSKFTTCSTTCGRGSRSRNRTCTRPTPRFGGKDCATLGPSTDMRECSPRPCPIHGNYTHWSRFSMCSASCGQGIKSRHRSCSSPTPMFGGDDCSMLGSSNESIPCLVRPCPVHGNYSAWTEFGPCSKSCENGTQIRRRYCNGTLPRFGGRNCSTLGPSLETSQCEVQACPDIDFRIKFKLMDKKWNNDLSNMSSRRYQILSAELQNSIIGLYEKKRTKQVNILEFSNGSVVTDVEVIYFSRYFAGAMALYDAFYASRRLGSYNVTPINFTSTDVPFGFVQNFTAFNRSSTSLGLRWSPVFAHMGNGPIWGYEATYTELSTGARNIYKAIFSNTTTSSLHKMKKYSWYTVRIAAINRRGVGVPSDPIVVLTDEDVPNASPNVKPFGYNTSSTSLYISWKAIARDDINGVLRGYSIFFKAPTDDDFQFEKVPSSSLSMTLSRLKKYTAYEIRVAGLTSKGVGGKSKKTVIYTDEDVPNKAPTFHSCRNKTSTAIQLHWYEIPIQERNGVIIGYAVFYREATFPDTPWNELDNILAETKSLVISNLTMFTKYSFEISAFTRKGGVRSYSIVVSTDEDVPSAAPSDISAVNTSSTSLWFKWSPLSAPCTRGILVGYVVFYKKENDSTLSYQSIDVLPTNTNLSINDLQKFTVYNISVAGRTSKGIGPLSPPIYVPTGEDTPSVSPVSVAVFNTSSTTIHVMWKSIPKQFINGILLGYHIYLRKPKETKIEKRFTVPQYRLSFRIKSLIKFTKYVVRVVGFTSVGTGLASAEFTVSTEEDAPSQVPREFTALSKASPTTIPLSWKHLKDPFYYHGRLLGYRIQYQLTHLAGVPLKYFAIRTNRYVGPNTVTYVLTDLEIYARYKIKIWAFTRIDDGPSSEISADTCNCRSSFQTNWWINPPYIYKNSSKISGILPAILPRMVSSCCEFCHEHISTQTMFENNKGSSARFLKPGVSAFRDSIGESADLHFPIYGQIYQVKYARHYEFIPLVESPGVVFLVLEDEPGTATRLLLRTLWDTFPVVILILILVWIFALLVWFSDHHSNSQHFPPTFLAGVYEGIWWSFITMTTVGYGDRFPRSFTARLFGITWILTGSILTSLYTSVMISDLTTDVVSTNLKLYGAKVAAIHNSSEHRLAVRKNGKLDLARPYNNLHDVYDSLSKRLVQGALIDAYVLGSRRDLFDKIDVRLSKIYDYSTAYGVVLSGEAMKLQKCFREYVKENKKEIFKIIEENVDMIEEDDVSQSVRRAETLIDPSVMVFKKTLFVCIILLLVATALSILFEFICKPLKRRFFPSKQIYHAIEVRNNWRSAQKQLQLEMREHMEDLAKKLRKLKQKHIKELKQLTGLKIFFEKRWSDDSLIFNTSVARYDGSHSSPSLPLKKLLSVSSNDNNKETEYSKRRRTSSKAVTEV